MMGCTETEEEIDCNRIIERDQKIECMYNESISNYNAVSCKDIPDRKTETKCINEIAVIMTDEYPCYQHTRLSDREHCERLVGDEKRRLREINKSGG